MTTTTTTATTTLRAVGFCGADDSVDPKLLGIFSHLYPFVEFGVLFRPDKEGQPRYASTSWVQELARVVSASSSPASVAETETTNDDDNADKTNMRMKLAAHLCGSRVDEVLRGDDCFVRTLPGLGFRRVQVNATAVNGVDMSYLDGGSAERFLSVSTKYPNLEFILQKNEETKPLWEGILNLESELAGKRGCLPKNISMLVDESKGTGVLAKSWPIAPNEYEIGYAGGIGPHNISKVLDEVMVAGSGKRIWIDMESSLRSIKNDKDIFDMDKCFQVICATCDANLYQHPNFLPSTGSTKKRTISEMGKN